MRERRQADAVHDGLQRYLEGLVEGTEDVRATISQVLEQVAQGDLTAPMPLTVSPVLSSEPATAVQELLLHVRSELGNAIVQAAQLQQRNTHGEQAQMDLLKVIARRQISVISRAVKAIDDAEHIFEDPDVTHALFGIDHLVTRVRRGMEGLAVLGGGALPGRGRQALDVVAVMRNAQAGIEEYPRVQTSFPQRPVALAAHVGRHTVHLLAELLENATKFAPSHTKVYLSAREERDGLVIAVQDQGVSISPHQLARLNQELAAPHTVDIYAQVKSDRIGLLIAGQLAQRCGIGIELHGNEGGPGTTAYVLIPRALLAPAPAPEPLWEPPAAASAVVPVPGPPHGAASDRAPGHAAVAPPAAPVRAVAAGIAVVPTEGRTPLPRRVSEPTRSSEETQVSSAQPERGRGATPGLMASFRTAVAQGRGTPSDHR
ncbi:ATPase (plasmid) [Streptomyces alboflavus]|uniref:histidine kinase n=2 Tax=Streptomyces alboflavus TaxID=67267 RepID=A0A291W4Q3_9ACTN|nr:ATPase [Streptomyces alboflavus]